MQCLEEAEEKSQCKRSPLMFESDEELIGDNENLTAVNKRNHTNDVSSSGSSCSITVLNEYKPLSKEEHLVNRLQTILTGIPPPPAVTVPQYDSDDILKLWKANEHLTVEYKKWMHPGASEQEQAAAEEAATTNWPEVSHCQCMGVCFNKGSLSEELEYLSAKYKERYVGNETSSCVNSLYTKQTTLTASAKKRARHRGWSQSPGRRLSHLARRRKAFTSASLQSVAENSSKHPEKKMILIDVKKTRCGKSKGNSCKKQSLLGNSDSHKVNSSKRALFQSPDDSSHINVPKRNRHLKCSPKNVRVQQSKRALWPSSDSKQVTEGTYVQVNVHRKRERAMCKASPRKKCNRNLFVNEEVRSCSSFTNTRRKTPKKTSYLECKRTPQKPSCSGLSNSHRQKLLWAISNALREQGIRMNHEMFRPCASVLFKVCQKLWLERRQKITNEGSTSESMLALARQFCSKVVNSVEKDPRNTNLAELCSDLIRAAIAEQLVEKEIFSEESVSSEVINAKSIRCDNTEKHNSTTQCRLDSEIPIGSNSKLKKTESLDYSVAKMQKTSIQNAQDSNYKLHIGDGSKQNFLFIEDEETTFSVLKNDNNTSDYKNGLHDIGILKTTNSPAEKNIPAQPSAYSSINCNDVSNMNRDFNLDTEAIPSCSYSTEVNGLNCVSDKSNFKQAVMYNGIPHTVTDTVCVLNSNDRMNNFNNLIQENAVTVQTAVNNIPVSEMLSWNADPISRLKSNTTLDVFANENLNTKVNVNVMSHWQNLVTRKEIKQKADCESPCENYCDPKLDNLCSLESTVDTDCSSSIHSNTVTNYDFSGIIDDSKGWLQSDPIQTYDAVHS